MKLSLEKQPRGKQGVTFKNPDLIGDIPTASLDNSGKSLGNPMVELATPKGT